MLIRNRLTLTFTLLATGIQLLLSVFAWYFYSIFREQEFYQRLEDTALVASRILITRRHLHDNFFTIMVKSDLLTIVDEQIIILDQDKNMVFTNRTLADASFFREKTAQIKNHEPVHFQKGRLEGTGLLFIDQGQQFYVFVAGYDSIGLASLSNFQLILPLINLLGFSLIVIAGWYFSNKALAPITSIIQEVDTITHQHLNKRVHEGNRKDEIAQLAITFNQMLFRLEKAFENQRSFVANASHELRTPLTNILGTLQTSLAYDQHSQDLKASMFVATEEIKKLSSLTNSLLNLAKLSDGNFAWQLVQVDDCLLNALDVIQTKYPQRKIKLDFMPPAFDTAYQIKGNSVLLTTALSNVIDNACKYSSLEVNVMLKHDDSHVHITVADQGIGIEPGELAQVTQPLFRGSNTTGVAGHGVGLAITRRIIEHMNGSILVQSQLGQGTTIAVTLPQTSEDRLLN